MKTFQAEDEIAAIGAAIGASYGGAMGLTASSGPGIALKSEALGLAVMVELPLVVIDVQRAGPSTGMPTKNEQADLLQVLFGRNSDSPIPVVAPATPGDCFDMAIEAWRIALKYVTPVVYLSDAFLATGSEPWAIPSIEALPDISVSNCTDPGTFQPYERDPETLARPWAVPGTPGLEHRIGGLEKADITGNVNYEPDNHHLMQLLRQEKIARIADDIPPLEVFGPDRRRPAGPRLGLDLRRDPDRGRAPDRAGPERLPRPPAPSQPVPDEHREGPPELPQGADPGSQPRPAVVLIRAQFLVDAVGYNRVRGKPFTIAEIVAQAERILGVAE